MHDLIAESLEACALRDIDVADDIYSRFFASDTAASDLMSHSDEYMRGRMLHEVIDLLLGDDKQYLSWEVRNHLQAYNVEIGMYQTFFGAVKAAVAAALDGEWTKDYEAAWESRISSLLEDIRVDSSSG